MQRDVYKFFTMQKHPCISSGSHSGICPFTPQVLHQFCLCHHFRFQRYVRRFFQLVSFGIKVYRLPCGCYVWVILVGVRELSALPFRGFYCLLKNPTKLVRPFPNWKKEQILCYFNNVKARCKHRFWEVLNTVCFLEKLNQHQVKL